MKNYSHNLGRGTKEIVDPELNFVVLKHPSLSHLFIPLSLLTCHYNSYLFLIQKGFKGLCPLQCQSYDTFSYHNYSAWHRTVPYNPSFDYWQRECVQLPCNSPRGCMWQLISYGFHQPLDTLRSWRLVGYERGFLWRVAGFKDGVWCARLTL